MRRVIDIRVRVQYMPTRFKKWCERLKKKKLRSPKQAKARETRESA